MSWRTTNEVPRYRAATALGCAEYHPAQLGVNGTTAAAAAAAQQQTGDEPPACPALPAPPPTPELPGQATPAVSRERDVTVSADAPTATVPHPPSARLLSNQAGLR